jgi:CheY-like chemotaxis protein
MLAQVLPSLGFAVWTASGAAEALDLLRGHGGEVDVALVDRQLRGPDGPRTLAALRQLKHDLACCLMTGSLPNAGWLHLPGCDRVLLKPFAPADLAGVLRELCGEPSARTARKINRRAKQIGTEPDYDETWGE